MSTDLSAQQLEVWTSQALPPTRQFEAWREVIVDAHLSWDIPKIACERFPAYMHQHRVDGMRLTDCTASARVSGTRERAQIARDGEAYLTVVMIAEGRETLRFGNDRELCLTEGMFTLWDSTQPMAFMTGDSLRQMSLLVPEPDLLRRMPRVRDLVGRPMDGRTGVGGMFMDHFRALMQRMGDVPVAGRQPMLEITLDLLTVCLSGQPDLPPPRLRRVLLEQVLRHIETHLADPSLGVSSLARAFGMTERNVHKLFEDTEATVSAHIRHRRLAMCRRDLEGSTLAARQIAEIAGHWGFADASHFSKAFRAAYGLSPTAFRSQAQAARGTLAA
ncbi:MAG TPA: helix-turn-helix domain-containing protein [Burkholderiaceae bacterium]|nr:helix-turn-helix domain-containing protein [Burkholderiaceae bacterium]